MWRRIVRTWLDGGFSSYYSMCNVMRLCRSTASDLPKTILSNPERAFPFVGMASTAVAYQLIGIW